MKTQAEIEDQQGAAAEATDSPSKMFSMSYEEGVLATLDWVLGTMDEPPIQEDEEDWTVCIEDEETTGSLLKKLNMRLATRLRDAEQQIVELERRSIVTAKAVSGICGVSIESLETGGEAVGLFDDRIIAIERRLDAQLEMIDQHFSRIVGAEDRLEKLIDKGTNVGGEYVAEGLVERLDALESMRIEVEAMRMELARSNLNG